MVNVNSQIVRMHQPYYPDLFLAGKNLYADRALLLSGTAIVSSGDDDFAAYLSYLSEVGIGAKEVIQVPGEDLYAALLEKEEIIERLRGLLTAGGKLEFFNSSLAGERLLQKFGLCWGDTLSPLPGVASFFDNKVYLRTLAGELQCGQVFPPHILCASGRRIHQDIDILEVGIWKRFRQKCDFLILKRPDLASGAGMIKLRTDSPELLKAQLKAYFAKYGEEKPFILEAGYEHTPVFIVWNIEASGARVLAITKQILNERFEHEGNIVSSGDISGISGEDRLAIIAKTAPFIWPMQGRGYRGVCGFDLMKTNNGMIFALECNARLTASSYAAGVGAQIEADCGLPWAIYMCDVYPAGINGFKDLVSVLSAGDGRKSVLFDRYSGVLPLNVRCLGLPKPKCGLMCIGENEAEAKKFFDEAVSRIENQPPMNSDKTP